VIACPHCRRRIYTRRDILYATIDGRAQCRVCGRAARLDLASRWSISCLIAILLPVVLLFADVFYSGHLLVVSILVVTFAWRVLSFVGFPLLALEPATGTPAVERRQSVVIFAVMLAAAIALDGYIASRVSHDEALEHERAVSAVRSAR
jgi:hypothetical protein